MHIQQGNLQCKTWREIGKKKHDLPKEFSASNSTSRRNFTSTRKHTRHKPVPTLLPVGSVFKHNVLLATSQ